MAEGQTTLQMSEVSQLENIAHDVKLWVRMLLSVSYFWLTFNHSAVIPESQLKIRSKRSGVNLIKLLTS